MQTKWVDWFLWLRDISETGLEMWSGRADEMENNCNGWRIGDSKDEMEEFGE